MRNGGIRNNVRTYKTYGSAIVCLLAIAFAAVLATASDIYVLASGGVTVEANAVEVNVCIRGSNRIVTPWVQGGYAFYLDHIDGRTKDIIKGSTAGVVFEWSMHNIAYYIEDDARAADVDIGATLFSDPHRGVHGNGMKVAYIVLGEPVCVVYDFIRNGGKTGIG